MINNKQILGSLKTATDSLKEILSHKNEILDSATSNLNDQEKKEYKALTKKLDVFIKNQDFTGAMNFISKYQINKAKK